MLVKAYGKINISLDVVGKREDGYHLLKMIMQNVDLYDSLSFQKCNKGINISCNKPYIPTDEKNLVYKAAQLFMDTYDIHEGINIYLKKNIPVAAGMAGGSADAAAVLKALPQIFKIDVDVNELMKLGVKIGADVPYCIMGGTALCEGIGEIITPLKPFKNQILVLVKPNFGVSTKEVFKNLDVTKIFKHPDTDSIIKAMEQENVEAVCNGMKNLLENVTLRKYPVLKRIKEDMIKMGAMGSMMSGSGPTIFAFFDDMLKAQRCYDKFKIQYKEIYLTRTI
ncbi:MULTISPECIES: 4-(cytidine 5'-diphospho)-2-C-methyl-D-erythritol kinase [Clostridium]|uniref:4-diphosphocytidyl-2-C-methyl-D-erythritol kinase n=1 Tax=Clostridium frigoriphilum TaxID=443253 RepID=A0ABU7US06_9CLOT|nr:MULTISPECIES: 4-(cytidine 5'-diphospho)-2-C-methyl-D-erythritol kinase [Clostridium]MBU3100720.1 4-(cytidine 5'-diphospho)-2-C-methyl-D-erythritol kinase [Clostridium sp. DSM 17811]MBU3176905.1 4-(cytidine 5'-diphospho)-2-C-methyl-D-erythritol kinase [Clostridium estertheticum]